MANYCFFSWFVFCTLLGFTFAGNEKNCFCKVVKTDNSDSVIHDFGSVERHTNWLYVSCNRLIGCPATCDRRAKEWACHYEAECKAKAGGKPVRSHYVASVCAEGDNSAFKCGC